MIVLPTIAETRQIIARARMDGKKIGFVPTMGYLHEGHMALVRKARAENDFIVVSIFVNPTQFGPGEDLASYPRDLERDKVLCQKEGTDLIFTPSVREMYPEPGLAFVEVEELSRGLCGRFRPGHFRGVATVVAKLFNIVLPDRAYFGEKDAQQLRVIKRMVRDLNFPVEIIGVPTVREKDGLAMSSRNTYLTPPERKAAPVLIKSLRKAEEMAAMGERDPSRIIEAMRQFICEEPLASVEYIEIVDSDSLKPVEELKGEILIALAVRIGKARLIDNITIKV